MSDIVRALAPVVEALGALGRHNRVAKGGAYDRMALSRVVRRSLDESPRPYDLSTAEDVILRKPEWFRLGNEILGAAMARRHRRPSGPARGARSGLPRRMGNAAGARRSAGARVSRGGPLRASPKAGCFPRRPATEQERAVT